MRLAVDRGGQPSIGEQLRAQLRYLILAGDLEVGERLPPVRTLAGFLRVNRNTVARVYRDLTEEGYLESTVGRGTFVAARRAMMGGLRVGVTESQGTGTEGGRQGEREAGSGEAETGRTEAVEAAEAGAGQPDGKAGVEEAGAQEASGTQAGAAFGQPGITEPEAGETVTQMIDRLLDVAAGAGLSVEDLTSALTVRAGRRREPASRPRIGFVECNPSDLTYFVNALRRQVAVPITPVLLDDVQQGWRELDLLATTFFHVEEVRRRVPEREVVGLMAVPDFATLARVAHLPKDRSVVLVCATAEGVRSKERSIRAVGIRRRRLLTATLRDQEHLRRTLTQADVVVASPKVLERIAAEIPARANIIPFGSVLSEGALALLHARIRTWQRHNVNRSEGRAWVSFA